MSAAPVPLLIAAGLVGDPQRVGSATVRCGMKLPSMSIPPTLALRSANCSGVISPRWSATQPVLDADVVDREPALAVRRVGRDGDAEDRAHEVGDAAALAGRVGRPGARAARGCRPQATFAVGTSSVRSAPNSSTFCPHRLSGFAGLLPHTGWREAAVGNSALGGAAAWPGMRQRARRPEVVHQHAAVERALHLGPVVLERLARGQAVEQPGVVLGQQVLLHRGRRAAVADRVAQRAVALDDELLGHHRRLGRDDVVAVVGVDVQARGGDDEAGAERRRLQHVAGGASWRCSVPHAPPNV